MDWTPVSYAYDGSFAGFLTCVFASYAHREEPMSFSTPEDGRISLWPERTVDTDETRAQRVYRSLAPRLGQEGRRLAVYGFLTCLEERELHLWRFLRLGYDRGPWVVRDLTDDRVAVLTRAVGHLTGEAHLLKGFTRFSEQEGVLVGEIAPKNRVLPLLRPHFCARYPEESFVLYDRTHREALFYRPRRWAIVPLEAFRAAAPRPGGAGLPPPVAAVLRHHRHRGAGEPPVPHDPDAQAVLGHYDRVSKRTGGAKGACTMKNVKIIVLRKGFYPDLIREHLTEPPEECVCDFFREGDQFLYTGGAEMPAGFCPWAWIDLYRSVSALSCGASYTPWQRREGVNVVCCTDGLRPVTFLLEAQ